MEIKRTEKCCIITPLSPKLRAYETNRLKAEILNSKDLRVGIDMSCVKDCTIDFISAIAEIKNLSCFNIPSDIFALLTNMNLDKTLSFFVSEMDFMDNKHRLLIRHFMIV